MNQQMVTNIQQQTKRLIDQLRQLQQNREDLTEEEYNQLKESTNSDLETFQSFLGTLQKGDQILDSEIEKSKKQLITAIKQSYNKEEIMASLFQKRVMAIRATVEELDKEFQMKSISEQAYTQKKRNYLIEIQETGIELTGDQRKWLDLHHFDESGSGQISQEAKQKQMEIAQKGIKKLN